MDAIESKGYLCDGRILALNSYENRVYQVGIEDQEPLIAKFYRPDRWRDEQITEEHHFCFELAEQELPVVAPLMDDNGESLYWCAPFRFALFPRRGGHEPDLDNPDNLFAMGRLLGRIHLVGASKRFEHRPELNSKSFGHASADLISERFIPAGLKTSYTSLARDLLQVVDSIMNSIDYRTIRTHGDCHRGNILWRDDSPNLVDLDDARMAPAIQDIWMLLSGDRHSRITQLSEVVDGYNEFFDFETAQLRLIEPLRTLRMMHYCAWVASRWDDPAFPLAFPWFGESSYWAGYLSDLDQQLLRMAEPPLRMYP